MYCSCKTARHVGGEDAPLCGRCITIVASVFVHGNELNSGQWAAVLIVFTGLGVEVADSEREKRAKKAAAAGAAPPVEPAGAVSDGKEVVAEEVPSRGRGTTRKRETSR